MEAKRGVFDSWGNWGTGTSSLPKSIHAYHIVRAQLGLLTPCSYPSLYDTTLNQKPQHSTTWVYFSQQRLIQRNGREKQNERKHMFENDYSSLLGWYSLWEVGRLAGLKVRTLWGVADLQFKNIQQKQKESWSSGLKMTHPKGVAWGGGHTLEPASGSTPWGILSPVVSDMGLDSEPTILATTSCCLFLLCSFFKNRGL